jgi:hypothetical protein
VANTLDVSCRHPGRFVHAEPDTAEGTHNTTVLVQMEGEERAIRAMPFVTTLSCVRAVKDKAEGWRVTLT